MNTHPPAYHRQRGCVFLKTQLIVLLVWDEHTSSSIPHLRLGPPELLFQKTRTGHREFNLRHFSTSWSCGKLLCGIYQSQVAPYHRQRGCVFLKTHLIVLLVWDEQTSSSISRYHGQRVASEAAKALTSRIIGVSFIGPHSSCYCFCYLTTRTRPRWDLPNPSRQH